MQSIQNEAAFNSDLNYNQRCKNINDNIACVHVQSFYSQHSYYKSEYEYFHFTN